MDSDTNTPFPAITEGEVGGALVPTTGGRDLHASLKVTTAFKDWMQRRIKEYGFVEGADFCSFLSESSGGRPRKEYALTLDMAKELAMVENNEQGRVVRRYFIQCEAIAKGKAAEIDMRAVGGMVKGILAKQLNELVPALVAAQIAAANYSLRRGKTAGQVWHDYGLPPIKGIAVWFGNRLDQMGCRIDGEGRGELGRMTARLYDPDRAVAWLRNGGRLMVDQKIAERRGQGRLRLIQTPLPMHPVSSV